MRPIRLVMSAFGPYAGEQVIDFRELGTRSFFLVHGPTGGGKTTILDAMCFALYGVTSGAERTAEQMRSQLALPNALTFVVLDFSLGNKSYRVKRSPEQQRPKLRGGGTTTDGPKATLSERTGLLDDKRNQLATAQQIAASHEGNVLACEQAQKQLNARRELDDAKRTVAHHEQNHRSLLEQAQRAEETVHQLKVELAALRQTWFLGQAAILANVLADGEPCPVCGSREHPAPATSEEALPSKEQMDVKQRALDAQERTAAKLLAQAQEAQIALTSARAAESALLSGLGAAATATTKELESHLEVRQSAMKASQAARDKAPLAEAEIADTEGKLSTQVAAMEILEPGLQAATDDVTRLRAIQDGYLESVPENLRSEKALGDARAKATSRLAEIGELVREATETAVSAEKLLSAASETHANAKVEVAQATGNLTRANSEFAGKREQAGFASDAEYRAAKLTGAQIGQGETEISQYDQSVSAATDRADRASQAASGLIAPDMAALARAFAEAKRDVESAIQQKAGLDKEISQFDRWIAALDQATSKLNALEQEYSVVGRISEVAQGRNGAGLTFQRFVLTFLLDDVLVAATERLRIMSKGRYHLQRRRDRSDLRTQSGLDLEVYDTYTGSARAAGTLSGGEGFLAALSLALGLADVVQAYAGGIRLETIFIDEGFGSLDSEALDLAIRSLVDLLKDGRLVGIISHVPELQERIDARLEVTAARSGSKARFVLTREPLS